MAKLGESRILIAKLGESRILMVKLGESRILMAKTRRKPYPYGKNNGFGAQS
jgi:hypothetical protein